MQSYRRSWCSSHTDAFAIWLLSHLQVSQGQAKHKLPLGGPPSSPHGTGQPMEMWHGPWEQICRTPGLSSASEKSRTRTGSRDGQRQMLRSGKGLQERAWRPLGWEVRWATGILTCFFCSSHRYQTKDVLDKKDSTHPGIPLYFGCNCFNCCSSDPKQATSEEY